MITVKDAPLKEVFRNTACLMEVRQRHACYRAQLLVEVVVASCTFVVAYLHSNNKKTTLIINPLQKFELCSKDHDIYCYAGDIAVSCTMEKLI